jgi:hypothetical protein
LEAVVDGVAAAAALPHYLPVYEPGDGVFDAGDDPAVYLVVVVADDQASGVAAWGRDRGDAAVSVVADNSATIEQLHRGVADDDDVIAVTGPALSSDDHAAPVSADDDLGVAAAAMPRADPPLAGDIGWPGRKRCGSGQP